MRMCSGHTQTENRSFLRWAALQDCAEVDPYDGQARVW
jgi:hypothetical protein